jgi:hypothetical protein
MPIQRMTAKKVTVSDLISGKWVKKEGMEPSFVVTRSGDEVSRARVMGTIVSSFIAEDGSFASITLDDTTETIRAKTFKTTKPVDDFRVGDIVDVIGKVREYLGEIYLIPEVIARIEDPNRELLRKLEIMKGAGSPSGESGEKRGKGKDSGELKREILRLIEGSEDGLEYGKILEKVKAKESEIESVVNDILSEGICYEPTPGKIKKI